MQKPIAWWIAKRRAPKSQVFYEQIGGGSPLNKITRLQGQALEGQLAEGLGIKFVRTAALNTEDEFITGLKKLVIDACKRKNWL